MAASMSGRDLFIIHNSFATIEWKIVDFSSDRLSAPSVTLNNLLAAGDVNPLDTSYPNVSMDSFI